MFTLNGSAAVRQTRICRMRIPPVISLHSKGRAASPFVVQSAASTVPCEWNSPGGISSRLNGNLDRTTGQSSGISSPFFTGGAWGISCCSPHFAGQGSAFEISLSPLKHLSDHRGQFPHHRHRGDRASPSPADPLVPLPQQAIFPQCLILHLGQ